MRNHVTLLHIDHEESHKVKRPQYIENWQQTPGSQIHISNDCLITRYYKNRHVSLPRISK